MATEPRPEREFSNYSGDRAVTAIDTAAQTSGGNFVDHQLSRRWRLQQTRARGGIT